MPYELDLSPDDEKALDAAWDKLGPILRKEREEKQAKEDALIQQAQQELLSVREQYRKGKSEKDESKDKKKKDKKLEDKNEKEED